jgi:glycosyltransferase involved in cell wall biosynthesis
LKPFDATKEKAIMKVGVYMDTGAYGGSLGGTEYCAAVIAEELSKKHQVDLMHPRTWFDKDEVYKIFGTNLNNVTCKYIQPQPDPFGTSSNPWRRRKEAEAWHAEVSQGYDFFLAYIHLIPPFCHAPDGMFTILFPFFDCQNTWPWQPHPAAVKRDNFLRKKLRKRYFDREWTRRLNSYPLKTVICEFTANWTRSRWGVNCEIHYPPARKDFDVAEKTDSILSVGRFTKHKNQLELVAAFRNLNGLRADGWHYFTVGGIEEGTAEGPPYFEAVRLLGDDHQVSAIGNIDRLELKHRYEQAKIFWHACGHHYNEREFPEYMEHFGIVTVEAMAAGAVPVVINKGGQREIVEHGVNGFLWNTLEELQGYTNLLARDNELRSRMGEAAKDRAVAFGKNEFIARFYELNPRLA